MFSHWSQATDEWRNQYSPCSANGARILWLKICQHVEQSVRRHICTYVDSLLHYTMKMVPFIYFSFSWSARVKKCALDQLKHLCFSAYRSSKHAIILRRICVVTSALFTIETSSCMIHKRNIISANAQSSLRKWRNVWMRNIFKQSWLTRDRSMISHGLEYDHSSRQYCQVTNPSIERRFDAAYEKNILNIAELFEVFSHKCRT